MIPAGYLLKRTVPPPGWLLPAVSHVTEVCSVASCVNDNVVDPQSCWKHNGFGLANSPQVLWGLAQESDGELVGSRLFYYAALEAEIESDGWTFDSEKWRPISRAASSDVADDIAPPGADVALILLGYDVVVFNDFLEHSPLSCNSIAAVARVNEFCLFNEVDEARSAIDSGLFGGGCEEGIYKIFSVSVYRQPVELLSTKG